MIKRIFTFAALAIASTHCSTTYSMQEAEQALKQCNPELLKQFFASAKQPISDKKLADILNGSIKCEGTAMLNTALSKGGTKAKNLLAVYSDQYGSYIQHQEENGKISSQQISIYKRSTLDQKAKQAFQTCDPQLAKEFFSATKNISNANLFAMLKQAFRCSGTKMLEATLDATNKAKENLFVANVIEPSHYIFKKGRAHVERNGNSVNQTYE